MTETILVESSVSGKGHTARKKAPAKKAAAKKAPNPARSAAAQRRWNGVSTEERSTQMRELIRKRWAADAEADAAMIEHFKTQDLDEAMEEYQAMRRTFEAAGKILDQRFQAERQGDEQCSNPACGKRFSRDVPWYSREAVRNPITGAAYNRFACSMACLIAIKGVGTQKRA